ncbi:MAG: hypothetical protein GOMPHAMPRED_000063 [Gomphillus americanus]|uniref:Uncharacterized protein n=1 Tax=Gomphillus americanus TaxID=1940652 RepID=A0A8H3EE68_9LECA|nr:MAG: hypothetical protein GOMPHAMPRED_000063 [Gomphillus americanus]
MRGWISISILSLVVAAIHTGEHQFRLSALEADLQKIHAGHAFPGWRSNAPTSPRNLQAHHLATVRRWINDADLPPSLHRRAPPRSKSRSMSPKVAKKTPYTKSKDESSTSNSLKFSAPKMPEPVYSAHVPEQAKNTKRRTRYGKSGSISQSGDLKDVQVPEAVESLSPPASP